MSPNGGPPNKYTKFPVLGLSSDDIINKLNDLADQGYNSVAVEIQCADGPFVFVGGYNS